MALTPRRPADLYATRKLSEGYPDLEQLAFEQFVTSQRAKPDDAPRVEWLLRLLGRLIALDGTQTICVIGCGPVPQPIRVLRGLGYSVTGVEPVPLFVKAAGEYLGDPNAVVQGAAESIPLPSESQDLVIFDNVLEHVESPLVSLTEIFRVLKPGGITYLTTTNRHRFSLVGENFEYNVPFFNWYPRLLKESYIFRHLHYEPRIANYTERPAVHWFSYADLCALGRLAGFAQFYSPLDLRTRADARSSTNPLKRWLLGGWPLDAVQRNPLLRSLALTQLGGEVVMLRRRT
jgi:SAM-dependent methyltransferase